VTILIVAGTRPEVIKLAPIYLALKRSGDNPEFLLSGQHQELATDLLDWFEISVTHFLEARFTASLSQNMATLLEKFEGGLSPRNYTAVVSQGDTTTALAAGMWAFFNRVPFFHIEAGLRCDTPFLPFPEEINRRLISQLADFNFCPTQQAATNLLNEGFPSDKYEVVGNTIVDALLFSKEKLRSQSELDIDTFPLEEKKIKVLVTAHRRESIGEPLVEICEAIKFLAEKENLQIIWPVHPNPQVAQIVRKHLEEVSGVKIVEPLLYKEMVALLQEIDFVLTDSGGLQEECAALGIPILILRNETERPEVIAIGIGKLVGTSFETIVGASREILYGKLPLIRKPSKAFGDGKSASSIVQTIKRLITC
jgi:UDP-N-acetylglucosamine 2-epimerase (non-hydrolysing)